MVFLIIMKMERRPSMSDPNQLVEESEAEAAASLRTSRVSIVVAVIATIIAIAMFFLNYFLIQSIRTKLADQGVSIEQARAEIAKVAQSAKPDPRFGGDTNWAVSGYGRDCTLGEIILTAGRFANGLPANGQLFAISQNQALFSVLGTKYGGDGKTTFALPDLRDVAPNGLTYSICTEGYFPSPR
jgi:hypothetical protein